MNHLEREQFKRQLRFHLDAGAKSFCVTRKQAEYLLQLSSKAEYVEMKMKNINKACKIAEKYLNNHEKY